MDSNTRLKTDIINPHIPESTERCLVVASGEHLWANGECRNCGALVVYSEAPAENPTDSDTYTVLEHERGGLEVWDCEAFGPWKLVAGPFTGPSGYAEACAALANYRTLTVPGSERS